jgi:1,4-alpha-glucan branching enzyme
VRDIGGYGWKDGDWMGSAREEQPVDAPISVYEVHLGSGSAAPTRTRMLSYKEAADRTGRLRRTTWASPISS